MTILNIDAAGTWNGTTYSALAAEGPERTGLVATTKRWQDAINHLSARGGGKIVHSTNDQSLYLLDQSIRVLPGISIEGLTRPEGQRLDRDYSKTRGGFRLANNASLICQESSAVSNSSFIRQGVTKVTTLLQAFQAQRDMIGTAVIANGKDITLEDLFFVGFDYAIMGNWCDRLTIENVKGDCRNGISICNSYDVTRLERCHFWPFLTGNSPGISNHYVEIASVEPTVIGEYRVICRSPHGLWPNAHVFVEGLPGRGQTRWLIQNVTQNSFELVGSIFEPGFVAGPNAWVRFWANRREGIAFELLSSDWPQLSNCFAYGYQTGYFIGSGCSFPSFNQCLADDNLALRDHTTVGVSVIGTGSRLKWTGGVISSMGTAILHNMTNTNQGSSHFGFVVLGRNGAFTGNTLSLYDGAVELIGCDLPAGRVLVTDKADGLGIHASDLRSCELLGTAEALAKVRLVGNRGK